MSLRAIDVWMSVGDIDADLSATDMIKRLLGNWVANAFEPLSLSGLWNGETVQRTELSGDRWEGIPLWQGEVDAGGPLTMVRLLESGLRQQLQATCAGSEIGISLGGPLYHRPPMPSSEPAWYGRAKLPGRGGTQGTLLELARVSVEWSTIGRHVVVSFPLSGYPITAVSPVLASGESIGRAGLPEILEDNRRRMFSWMANLPRALGLPTRAIEWEINADAALFDDDIEALRAWEHWLRSAGDR